MSKEKNTEIDREKQYKVMLKEAARVGGVTLRPDRQHKVSGRALEKIKAKVAEYAPV